MDLKVIIFLYKETYALTIIFIWGPINKKTRDYIFPIHAHKNCKYCCCPECNDDVIFRNGKNKNSTSRIIKILIVLIINPRKAEIHKGGKNYLKIFLILNIVY